MHCLNPGSDVAGAHASAGVQAYDICPDVQARANVLTAGGMLGGSIGKHPV
jgi:hypothetical protein